MFDRLRTAGLTAAAVFFCAAAPVLAETVVECRIDQHANNGNWIPDLIYVSTSDKGTFVLDWMIQHYVGGPLEAKVDTDNSKRTTWTWRLKTKSSTNQTSTMAFRLTMMKADKSASVSATPVGFAGNYTARGKCKQVKG
jgi:hypothetical protein